MSFVKRLTNLGRGLWKTRGTWSGEREAMLDAELAREPVQPRPAPRGEQARVRPRPTSPVQQLAALERALRDGEISEVEFRTQHARIMSQAVGDDETPGASPPHGKKTL